MRLRSLLLIDDEADNASINVNSEDEASPSTINGQIKKLFELVSKEVLRCLHRHPICKYFD